MSQFAVDHQAVIDRFVDACHADPRVVAATLYGSRASDLQDEHSDLDLALITTDEGDEGFVTGRDTFVRLLGEPLFVEDFDIPDMVFAILNSGVEFELLMGKESKFSPSHGGPFRVLLDKRGILEGVAREDRAAEQAEQVETLRRLITWFWHDMSHFITAAARGQLWWADGQLNVLRLTCINLARLKHDFSDPDADEDGFFKVDSKLPAASLSPLEDTVCPLEQGVMLAAAQAIIRFYRELAQPLAEEHGLAYPAELDRIMVDRLHALGGGN